MSELWQIETDGPIMRMSFQDAQGRNRITSPLLEEAREVLKDAVHQGIRVVIVAAVPVSGIWSSGHDISEIPQEQHERTWANPLENFLEFFRRVPLATIAEVDGDVWGGACELMLSCDLVVATADRKMAVTPARLGVGYPASGVARFLASFPVHVVSRMFMTAQPITMVEAARWGAVNELVESSEDLRETTARLAGQIARNAPLSIAAFKIAAAEMTDTRLSEGAELRVSEAVSQAWISDDLSEGLTAFAERRRPEFKGT